LVFRLTGALPLEFDEDQVSGGNRSLTVGRSRSTTTVSCRIGSLGGAGDGAAGIESWRLISFFTVFSCPRTDLSFVTGEAFFATIVGALKGRVGALGI
jgi:hypothetical protein